MKDIYQTITDRILASIDKGGIVPWQKPWNKRSGFAKNLVSGKDYKGINWLTLNLDSPHASPLWMTFRQAREAGGAVKAGEKSSPVIFWKLIQDPNSDDNKTKIPLLRHANVFNVEQCENVRIPDHLQQHVPPALPPIETCEQIAAKSGVKIITRGDKAFYAPSSDVVVMPPKNLFKSSEHYYQTLFHELGHASGHASRLNREGVTNDKVTFGSPLYAKEELIAEITACFLCAEAGITPKVDNSAAYIQDWRSKLKKDPKLIMQASSAAQKASDKIRGVLPDPEQTTAPESKLEQKNTIRFVERIQRQEPHERKSLMRSIR